MEKNFFVLLTLQGGGCAPMVDEDEEMAVYENEESARADANNSMLGSAFGFEIFERGTGSA